MPDIKTRPISKDEISQMIIDQDCLATMVNPNTGVHIVRNEHRRRDHEIMAHALRFYLENVLWINPNAIPPSDVDFKL